MTPEKIEKALAVVGAVTAWRGAECMFHRRCLGDNHVMKCPVEIARQDLIASHNAYEATR